MAGRVRPTVGGPGSANRPGSVDLCSDWLIIARRRAALPRPLPVQPFGLERRSPAQIWQNDTSARPPRRQSMQFRCGESIRVAPEPEGSHGLARLVFPGHSIRLHPLPVLGVSRRAWARGSVLPKNWGRWSSAPHPPRNQSQELSPIRGRRCSPAMGMSKDCSPWARKEEALE